MFIPIQVELAVGSIATALLPVRRRQGNRAILEMIQGEVVRITKKRDVTMKCVDIVTQQTVNYNVAEFRVLEFTFGGIPVVNPKFDRPRIEKEDNVSLGSIIMFP